MLWIVQLFKPLATVFCLKYLFEEFCAVSGGLTDISDKKSYSYNL